MINSETNWLSVLGLRKSSLPPPGKRGGRIVEEEDPFDPDTKGEIGSLFYFVLCMTAFQRNSVVVAQAKTVAGIEQRRANRKSNRSVELFFACPVEK